MESPYSDQLGIGEIIDRHCMLYVCTTMNNKAMLTNIYGCFVDMYRRHVPQTEHLQIVSKVTNI